MKVQKTPLIILCVFAVICIALGVFILLPKTEPSPVAVSQKIEIVKVSEGHWEWRGKIKNVSQEDVYISSYDLRIYVTTDDEEYKLYGPLICHLRFGEEGEITLAPGEEYDLSAESVGAGVRIPVGIEKVETAVGKYSSVIQGKSSADITQIVFGVILFVAALTFICSGAGIYILSKRRLKRAEVYMGVFSGFNGRTFYVTGNIGDKNEERKAIAKTAATAAGAVVSALFLGVGFYKVYSGAKGCEFMLTDSGLYVGNPRNKNISMENMAFLDVAGAKLISNNRKAKLVFDNGSYVALDYKICGLEKNVILEMLGNAAGCSNTDLPSDIKT